MKYSELTKDQLDYINYIGTAISGMQSSLAARLGRKSPDSEIDIHKFILEMRRESTLFNDYLDRLSTELKG